jgi:hypothetical protein
MNHFTRLQVDPSGYRQVDKGILVQVRGTLAWRQNLPLHHHSRIHGYMQSPVWR